MNHSQPKSNPPNIPSSNSPIVPILIFIVSMPMTRPRSPTTPRALRHHIHLKPLIILPHDIPCRRILANNIPPLRLFKIPRLFILRIIIISTIHSRTAHLRRGFPD